MIGSTIQWVIKIMVQALLWASIFSIKWDGQMIFDHIHERVLTNEVVGIFESAVEEVWSVWVGDEIPKIPEPMKLKNYHVQRPE